MSSELIERLEATAAAWSGWQAAKEMSEAAAALREAEVETDRLFRLNERLTDDYNSQLGRISNMQDDLSAARAELTLAQESREGWRQRCEMAEEAAMKDRARIALLEEGLTDIQDKARDWEGLSISELADDIDTIATAALLGEQADG
jgi:chromosome segregation ATPase